MIPDVASALSWITSYMPEWLVNSPYKRQFIQNPPVEFIMIPEYGDAVFDFYDHWLYSVDHINSSQSVTAIGIINWGLEVNSRNLIASYAGLKCHLYTEQEW